MGLIRLIIAVVVVVALVGLGLSVSASNGAACDLTDFLRVARADDGCGWSFDPWWGFWVSVAGCAAVAVALLVGRRRWPRAGLVIAAVAACVALSPIPIENVEGTPILKD